MSDRGEKPRLLVDLVTLQTRSTPSVIHPPAATHTGTGSLELVEQRRGKQDGAVVKCTDSGRGCLVESPASHTLALEREARSEHG